jgi:hypothetical protein
MYTLHQGRRCSVTDRKRDYLLIVRRIDDPDGSPLFGTDDPEVIQSVLDVLSAKLRGRERARLLTLAQDEEPKP